MTYLPSAHRIFRPVLAAALAVASLAVASTAQAAPVGAFTTKGTWHFHSAGSLHPPKLKVLQRKGGLANGDFLAANLPNAFAGKMTGEGGPLILDNKARPVWVLGVGPKLEAGDLQVERYQAPPCVSATCAQPVLVWWEGVQSTHGITTKGKVFVANQSYRVLRTFQAASPWKISVHDHAIIGHDMWVTVYRLVPHQNLKRYGGPHSGTVYDVGLQEYDLTTGKQVGKTWDALNPGHRANLPLSASETPVPHRGSWDAYHLNSIQPLPDGNLLVSMRDTEAVYLINPTTGKILWTLGGKHSTFKFGKGARFFWQHDAQALNPGTTGLGTSVKLTIFNDNCCKLLASGGLGAPNGPSEGQVLRLNTVTKTAKLVKAYRHKPKNLEAGFLGSMELLPNGNALVGWGSDFSPLTYFSEYSKSGKQILDVQWPHKDQSYRVNYAQTPSTGSCPASEPTCWVGTPFYKPQGAAKQSGSKATVYASWNGATQVAKWRVLAGNGSVLKNVATKSRSGFETAIALSKHFAHYQVVAVDAHGNALGASKTFS